MKRLSAIFSLALLIVSPLVTAAPAAAPKRHILDTVSPTGVYGLCKTMCSTEFAGRLTGHEGYTKAARWAERLFRQWGLKPAGDGTSCLQSYPSPHTVIEAAEMHFFLPAAAGAAATEIHLKPVEEFLPLLYADNGERRGGAVFVGWGISAPEIGYDDYQGVDVQGKFVLCFRGVPDPADKRFQTHDEHRTRMLAAAARGALGLVYLYPEVDANPNGDRIPGFLPMLISEAAGDKILAPAGTSCAALKKKLRESKRPASQALAGEIAVSVKAAFQPEGVGYNVAAYIPGSDPRLRQEFVIVGAHFDHCGKHMNTIFPGADDNASGSAVVMEMARVLAGAPVKPKRSVMFVLFGGEELGLQGSRHFAAHLPAVCGKIVGMFNYDMVGEGDGSGFVYSENSPGLKECLEAADREVHTLRRSAPLRDVGVRSSDFAPFFLQGVPCVSFWSNGPHLAYHQAGDSIYRINPDIMADVAKVSALAVWEWADR